MSVIVPACNASGFIRRALDSLPAGGDVCEVMVVDDGSSDGTAAAARSWFSERGINGRVMSLGRNCGPAAARNHGIAQARGDWVAFLDADDGWLAGKLELQLALARQNPEIALWCGETCHAMAARAPAEAEWNELVLQDFAQGNPVATSTVLVKAGAIRSVGGFDESFRGPEDYDLWMRMAARFRLARIAAPLAWRGERRLSLSNDDTTFLPEVMRVLDKAFDRDGALAAHPEWRCAALSNQYWNASWMAFCSGARGRAIRHLARAWLLHRKSPLRPARAWVRLGARYIFGRRQGGWDE